MKNNKGFTLIEVLIFVAIIAVVLGISVSVLATFRPQLKLSGSARDMITDIRYAQQITLTEQVRYCLKVFPSDKKYQVMKCSDSTVILERILPSEITSLAQSGFTNDTVEFNPYGAVKESGTITIQNNLGKSKIIDVRPSGFTRIN